MLVKKIQFDDDIFLLLMSSTSNDIFSLEYKSTSTRALLQSSNDNKRMMQRFF
jgi:hypothetical protein